MGVEVMPQLVGECHFYQVEKMVIWDSLQLCFLNLVKQSTIEVYPMQFGGFPAKSYAIGTTNVNGGVIRVYNDQRRECRHDKLHHTLD
jgi:hypothetical protein